MSDGLKFCPYCGAQIKITLARYPDETIVKSRVEAYCPQCDMHTIADSRDEAVRGVILYIISQC